MNKNNLFAFSVVTFTLLLGTVFLYVPANIDKAGLDQNAKAACERYYQIECTKDGELRTDYTDSEVTTYLRGSFLLPKYTSDYLRMYRLKQVYLKLTGSPLQ